MNASFTKLTSQEGLPWLAALLALPLAAWMMLNSYGSINVDGILYVEAASKFGAGEWRQGFELYNWPFNALLMAAIHRLLQVDYEVAAHLLDATYFALLTAGIVTLVRENGGGRPEAVAAAVLLFASSSIVRTYVPMVLRDPGFWAFHVWSIVFLVRFLVFQRWPDALAWQIIAAVATLFRIEGLTYMAVMPLLILWQRPASHRLGPFLKANVLLITGATLVLAALLLHPEIQMQKLGRLEDPVGLMHSAYTQLAHGLLDKAHAYGQTVLGKFISSYGMDGLLLTLIYILVIKVSTSAGWMQLVLAAYAKKHLPQPRHAVVLAWLVGIGITHGALMLISKFLLPKRYLMPIAFVIIIYAAFGLAALYRGWRQKPIRPWRGNWMFPLAMGVLLVQFGYMLFAWNAERGEELRAAVWIKQHAPATSRLFGDSPRLRYYARTAQPFRRGMISMDEVKQLFAGDDRHAFDYLLVHDDGDRKTLREFLSRQPGVKPIATIARGRDTITIYELSS